MALPRILSLSMTGELQIMPAEELEVLRTNHRQFSDLIVSASQDLEMENTTGDSLEIHAIMDPQGAKGCGLKLRCSPDGKEETLIVYRPEDNLLSIDAGQSSTNPDVVDKKEEIGPLTIPEREMLNLRIFLDRSVVEVFANNRQCLTKRIYPSRPDSLGVRLIAEGGNARLISLDVWDMRPIWPIR
jgi:beta-fructofuranosidase